MITVILFGDGVFLFHCCVRLTSEINEENKRRFGVVYLIVLKILYCNDNVP